ncbi:MAG: hypothetical protein H6724_01270 [Sandaracinus sp.]|nr:hypothetical protein [Sandaracinus sp.]
MHSSNVGTARIVEAVGADPIVAMVESLAWNEAFHLHGRHADAALVPHDDPERHARFASGIGTEATLLHLASAYGAIANGGEWIEPTTRGDGARRCVMDSQVSATLLGFSKTRCAKALANARASRAYASRARPAPFRAATRRIRSSSASRPSKRRRG